VEVALQALENIDPVSGDPKIDPALEAPTGELAAPSPPAQPNLVADVTKGTLILDGDGPALAPRNATAKPKTPDTCSDTEENKRVRPISANDLRARGTGGC
jgi:hypothetical protein